MRLHEGLPKAIAVGEKVYPIGYSFSRCARVIAAFEDGMLTDSEKMGVMLKVIYCGEAIDGAYLGEAAAKAVRFLNGGRGGDEKEQGDMNGGVSRLFSFTQDAPYIYTAVRRSHGVDLITQGDTLHWWQFLAMLSDLREDCFFVRLLSLRRRKQMGQLSADEKKLCAALEGIIDLPKDYSPEERGAIDDFMALVASSAKG